MIRRIDWRSLEVRARTETAPHQANLENMQKLPYHGVSALTRSARTSARTKFWCTLLNFCDHGDVF